MVQTNSSANLLYIEAAPNFPMDDTIDRACRIEQGTHPLSAFCKDRRSYDALIGLGVI